MALYLHQHSHQELIVAIVWAQVHLKLISVIFPRCPFLSQRTSHPCFPFNFPRKDPYNLQEQKEALGAENMDD